jgi:hypothetical protein
MSHRSGLVPLALSLVLTSAGAARADSGGGWQSWVNALTPEQLCAAYLNDIISDEDLPGGRASDPCPPDAKAEDYPW